MPQADQLENEARRMAGQARLPQHRLPTYQELLDGALEATFPASDPIAATAATQVLEPHTTLRDARDWSLQPAGTPAAAPPGPGWPPLEGPLAAPCEGLVRRLFTLRDRSGATQQVPRGPCRLQQGEQHATLSWTEDGLARHATLSIEAYRDRLAAGDLARVHDC